MTLGLYNEFCRTLGITSIERNNQNNSILLVGETSDVVQENNEEYIINKKIKLRGLNPNTKVFYNNREVINVLSVFFEQVEHDIITIDGTQIRSRYNIRLELRGNDLKFKRPNPKMTTISRLRRPKRTEFIKTIGR